MGRRSGHYGLLLRGSRGLRLRHGVFEQEHDVSRIFPEADEHAEQRLLVEREELREVIEDGAFGRTAARVAHGC